MKSKLKFYYTLLAAIFFVFLPILFFIRVDIPSRTFLKDIISIITIISFFIIIGQFYLTRINRSLNDILMVAKTIKIHKFLGYTFLPIFFIHPFLIVVPRYFEVGPNPIDSFIKMLTTFDNLGVLLGIIAWVLMLILGLTSMFRNRLNISYKTWKIFHGILSLGFIIVASWHAINLGRHMDKSMIILTVFAVFIASFLLIKSYVFKASKVSNNG